MIQLVFLGALVQNAGNQPNHQPVAAQGGSGALAAGRQREGAPKEGSKKFLLMEPVKRATEA
jgi:hypothetical protein